MMCVSLASLALCSTSPISGDVTTMISSITEHCSKTVNFTITGTALDFGEEFIEVDVAAAGGNDDGCGYAGIGKASFARCSKYIEIVHLAVRA